LPTLRASAFVAIVAVIQLGCASHSRVYHRPHEIRYFDGQTLHRLSVEDTLRIGNVAGGVKFEIRVSSDHGHTCHMSGTAVAAGDAFEYREVLDLAGDPGEAPVTCLLRLRIDGGKVRIEDIGRKCRLYYCGVRAALHGLEFSR
jgi:hypothetical protein